MMYYIPVIPPETQNARITLEKHVTKQDADDILTMIIGLRGVFAAAVTTWEEEGIPEEIVISFNYTNNNRPPDVIRGMKGVQSVSPL